MKKYSLTKQGLEKISKLQDKYRFKNEYELTEDEEIEEFLEALKRVYYDGLNMDQEDIEFMEHALEMLQTDPDDYESDFVVVEVGE